MKKTDMKQKYRVLNYHNMICLPTEDDRRELFIDAGELTELKSASKVLTLEQIDYINYKSQVFKTGRLQFEEADEAELFEYLDIKDFEDMFKAEEIMDIIKNPNKEKRVDFSLKKLMKLNYLSI